MCYTYDSLNRVTKRQVISLSCNCLLSEENYTYDAAGNITDAPNSCFKYDTNNRLVVFNGNTVSYDMDGNMLSNGVQSFTYDSANRLITAGGHTYTYNAEDVRIKNLCQGDVTTYTYNTNCRLSQLLQKTTNGITTKYVYGLSLIGEEKQNCFKTYHFDFRGSTVAITDICGNITDTFKYDTYGKLISRTGNSFVIFGYNGRDGVVTDRNGLIYMRARYYSPDMRRFINADIISGEISDSTSLNRYSYVNGNPVSFVDPFGLAPERGTTKYTKTGRKANDSAKTYSSIYAQYGDLIIKALQQTQKHLKSYNRSSGLSNAATLLDSLEDANKKISDSINNGSELADFSNGLKVHIYLDPDYNTSGDELALELMGFVPILGEISAIVDFASSEKRDDRTIAEVLSSLAVEDNILEFIEGAEILKPIGYVFDALGILNIVETIINWDSESKLETGVIVIAQCQTWGYRYRAVVDDELMFTMMDAGPASSLIKPEDSQYLVQIK